MVSTKGLFEYIREISPFENQQQIKEIAEAIKLNDVEQAKSKLFSIGAEFKTEFQQRCILLANAL